MIKSNNDDREIEWRWMDVDIKKIRELLVKNNATLVYPKTIMPLMVFTHPLKKKDSYIRIRYEGTHISLTSKTNLKSEYVTEYEVTIDNFAQGIKILLSIGCMKKYYVEKMRETWRLPGCKEIVIDSYPGTYEYLEIDAYTEKDLIKTAKLLGLSKPINDDNSITGISDVYRNYYGMLDNRKKNYLTFKDAYKLNKKYITKNRQKFRMYLKEQQKYYKSLKFNIKEIYHLI